MVKLLRMRSLPGAGRSRFKPRYVLEQAKPLHSVTTFRGKTASFGELALRFPKCLTSHLSFLNSFPAPPIQRLRAAATLERTCIAGTERGSFVGAKGVDG
jgi:hypothetical protein